MKLRKAFFPLYVVSKLLCICPFSLMSLQPSILGSIITICQTIGYAIFHLWSVLLNQNKCKTHSFGKCNRLILIFRLVKRDISEETAKNVVRQLIDSYNRYSGFCVFCFVVIASTANQRKIVTVIRNIEEVDIIFEEKLNTPIDNHRWRRYAFRDSFIHQKLYANFHLTEMFCCKYALPLFWYHYLKHAIV